MSASAKPQARGAIGRKRCTPTAGTCASWRSGRTSAALSSGVKTANKATDLLRPCPAIPSVPGDDALELSELARQLSELGGGEGLRLERALDPLANLEHPFRPNAAGALKGVGGLVLGQRDGDAQPVLHRDPQPGHRLAQQLLFNPRPAGQPGNRLEILAAAAMALDDLRPRWAQPAAARVGQARGAGDTLGGDDPKRPPRRIRSLRCEAVVRFVEQDRAPGGDRL